MKIKKFTHVSLCLRTTNLLCLMFLHKNGEFYEFNNFSIFLRISLGFNPR